jgi:protein O-GlcNAc transferase
VATAFVEQALAQELDARHAEALFDLGNLLGELDLTAAAIAVFERALKIVPGHSGLLINLGVQLDRADERDRAEECYRNVLERRPSEIAALANLAHLLFAQERFDEALEVYDRLVAAAPDAPAEIWSNRGVSQRWVRDPGAEASFRRALSLAPDSPQILANLGFLLCERRRFEDARPLLQRSYALDPSRLQVAAQLLDLDLQFAEWSDFERKRSAIIAGVTKLQEGSGQTVPPFAFLSVCDDPQLQLAAARSFAWPPAAADRPAANVVAGAPLRLGFAASAFHDHPVPRLIIELLERLDRGRFESFAYAFGTGPADALRSRVAAAVSSFAELAAMTTSGAVTRIRADAIDILFDLSGHTEHARQDVFAARPAAVQINFVGHAGTLGAPYYDYIVTDATTTPPSEQVYFTEQFLDIGECYLPSDARRVMAEPPPSRTEYGLPSSAFVFCAQAAPYKILPEMFDLWMRLVAAIGNGVLWLRPMHSLAADNLRAAAHGRGVDPERLVFAPREPTPRYLARFRLADLYLDTYPFGSHTTVNDALFAGLPVLTLSGRSMAARSSASQLRAVGLQEMIAASHDEYESIALTLARNHRGLAELTTRLRTQGRASPLFDMQSYTRHFEAQLTRIWREHVGAKSFGHPGAGRSATR